MTVAGDGADPEEPAKKAGTPWGCLALVATPILLFAGCMAASTGSSSDDAESPSPVSSANERRALEERFVSTVRQVGDVGAVSDEALITAGRETCGALERGANFDDVVLAGMAEAGTDGGVIIGVAVPAFCPPVPSRPRPLHRAERIRADHAAPAMNAATT